MKLSARGDGPEFCSSHVVWGWWPEGLHSQSTRKTILRLRKRSSMSSFKLWIAIGMLVLASSAGDIMLSAAMKRIGDLEALRAKKGLLAVIGHVIQEKLFLIGLCCLIFSFFCLLTALSWGDASLVAPASASLTYICSAILAKFVLHENVDRRRWLSAALVCVGVLLLVK